MSFPSQDPARSVNEKLINSDVTDKIYSSKHYV